MTSLTFRSLTSLTGFRCPDCGAPVGCVELEEVWLSCDDCGWSAKFRRPEPVEVEAYEELHGVHVPIDLGRDRKSGLAE